MYNGVNDTGRTNLYRELACGPGQANTVELDTGQGTKETEMDHDCRVIVNGNT